MIGVVLAGVVGLAERRLGPRGDGAVGEQFLEVPADGADGVPEGDGLRLPSRSDAKGEAGRRQSTSVTAREY